MNRRFFDKGSYKKVLEFDTTFSGTFNPTISDNDGVITPIWSDNLNNSIKADTPNFEYGDNSTKTVYVWVGINDDPKVKLLVEGLDISGSLNLSNLNLDKEIDLRNNGNVTSVNFPVLDNTYEIIRTANTTLGGIIDLSSASGVGLSSHNSSVGTCILDFRSSNITGLRMPSSNTNGYLSRLYLSGNDLQEELDLSGFTEIYDEIDLTGNTNLPSLIPVNGKVGDYILTDCDLITNLDLSTVTDLGSLIINGSGISSINIPNSINKTQLWFLWAAGDIRNLSGDLDLSNFTVNGGDRMWVTGNSNLEHIIFPVIDSSDFSLQASSCNLGASTTSPNFIDVSNITDPKELQLAGNPLLQSITLDSFSSPAKTLYFHNCDLGYIDFTVCGTGFIDRDNANLRLQDNSMTATEVDHILVDLDNNLSGGFSSQVIEIHGTNAAATDGSSTGYDGLTAKSNLQGKGFTVTTN